MKFNFPSNSPYRLRLKHRLALFLLLAIIVIVQLRPYSKISLPEGHFEMSPLLESGQNVYLYQHSNFEKYQKGDIIWYSRPKNQNYRLGRVVGTTGDNISVRDGILYCNDQALPETAHGLPEKMNRTYSSLQPMELFVVHDQQSSPFDDSLTLGALSEMDTEIKGKLFFFIPKSEPKLTLP